MSLNSSTSVPKVFEKLACLVSKLRDQFDLKNQAKKQEQTQMYHTDSSSVDNSWFDDGWRYDEWNDDGGSVSWHECWNEPDGISLPLVRIISIITSFLSWYLIIFIIILLMSLHYSFQMENYRYVEIEFSCRTMTRRCTVFTLTQLLFSPTVLIKWIPVLIDTRWRHSTWMAQESYPQQVVLFNHHGTVTLVDVVFLIVARLLLWRRLVDKRSDLDSCWNTYSCRVSLVFAVKAAGGGGRDHKNCHSTLVWGRARETLVSRLVWSLLLFAYVVETGRRPLTIEQVETQLQQEMITLNAQVADRTGPTEAVRAINNLATARVRKDTPSLIGVRGG